VDKRCHCDKKGTKLTLIEDLLKSHQDLSKSSPNFYCKKELYFGALCINKLFNSLSMIILIILFRALHCSCFGAKFIQA
jgi:hypothetical protein